MKALVNSGSLRYIANCTRVSSEDAGKKADPSLIRGRYMDPV
jgi:hypothetical protein